MKNLSVISALFFLIVYVSILFINITVKKRYLNALNYLTLYLIIDVFLPAIYGGITGNFCIYSYFNIISEESIFLSVFIFGIAGFIFYMGYINISNKKIVISSVRDYGDNYEIRYNININWLYIIYIYALFLIIWKLYFEYSSCGSYQVFYKYKITRAYLQTLNYRNSLENLLGVLNESAMTLLMIVTSIMITNARKYGKNFLWGCFFPVLTFIIALTTLYRGTILSYALMLMLSFEYKMYDDLKQNDYFVQNIKVIFSKYKKIILKVAIFGVIGFVIYGAIRTNLSMQRWGNGGLSISKSITSMFKSTLGVSLIALARVIEYVNSGKSLFHGESITQMFLSFIPRSFYPNKPTQYGIITLSTAMGSPTTTMDAVTMAGEMIINFGYIGIILVSLFGFFFGKFDRLKYNERYKFMYCALINGIVTKTFWMSFTGLFATFKYFPIYIIATCLILSKNYIKKPIETNIRNGE